MRRALLALALCAVPFGASALECSPPTAQHLFVQAERSEARFIVAVGAFKADRASGEAVRPYRFIGKSLSKAGYVTPFAAEVTVQVVCQGTGCPDADPPPQTGELLVFLQSTASGYVLEQYLTDFGERGSCRGGFYITGPSQAELDTVLACFQGQKCRRR